MNDNELNRIADLIFTKINSVEAEQLTREERVNKIKGVIIEVDANARRAGRRQIINHFEVEVLNLKSQ